jgi:hypothetical protein
LLVKKVIALMHVPGYFDGAAVENIDGNQLNNHPTNLRWVKKLKRKNDKEQRSKHMKALWSNPEWRRLQCVKLRVPKRKEANIATKAE